jgi:hydrophobic/amphiphilic exporter-1 (mainly G- bacteria), HAE1 family
MTISEICVKRPVFAVMLIGFLVVLGIFSFRELGVDLFPRAEPAVVNVSIRLPGATAEEVVSQVLLPLEEAVSAVSGLDDLASRASEGSGTLTCTFTLERDIASAAQDVREKVSAATRKLPSGIDPPIITTADPDADPVLSMVVSGGGSLRQTTEIANDVIIPALETVNGVAAVNLSGGRPRQIRIFADADKLEAYGITVSRLESAVQSQNTEVPGGTIIRGDAQLGVRTLGRIESPEQFNDIVLANVRGSPVRLRDVGRVEDSYPEPTSWNLLRGQEAIVLSLQRQSGTNTLEVIQAAKTKLQQIRNTLPAGLNIELIQDNSTFIRASVNSLEEHLLFGSLLASLVVMLFIGNWRSVLIAALAIPTSIIATFTLLKAMDFTLNAMTLLGLTLAVGIVIDDAIVVLENIVRFVEEKDYEPRRAAIEATKEITLAVMATTLSLVIIFVPIAFTAGYARVYLNSFGWTMAFSVMVSMLVSLTLTPTLCARLLKRTARTGAEAAAGPDAAIAQKPLYTSKESFFFRWMDRMYGKALIWALDHRAITALVAIGTFALTFPLNRMVGREFVPPDDQSELRVSFTAPVDTSLEGTEKVARKLAARVEAIPGVRFTWASVANNYEPGRGQPDSPGGPRSSPVRFPALQGPGAHRARQRRQSRADSGHGDRARYLQGGGYYRPGHEGCPADPGYCGRIFQYQYQPAGIADPH